MHEHSDLFKDTFVTWSMFPHLTDNVPRLNNIDAGCTCFQKCRNADRQQIKREVCLASTGVYLSQEQLEHTEGPDDAVLTTASGYL